MSRGRLGTNIDTILSGSPTTTTPTTPTTPSTPPTGDKALYETAYKGLANRVKALPAESTLTRAMKARRKAVMDEEAKRVEAVKSGSENWVAAKEAAVELKKKLDLYDTAAALELKLKGDAEKLIKTDPIDKAKLIELANKPGGDGALDSLVAGLGELAPRKQLGPLLEARFKLTLTQYTHQKQVPQVQSDGTTIMVDDPNYDVTGLEEVNANLPDKSLKRLYQLLNRVPEHHARENDKVAKIIRFTDDRGGAAYGGGEIYLNCGRSTDAASYELCKQEELLGEVEANCQPKEMDPKKRTMQYFDFATLHEVGHAVDDKVKFMDSHGSDAKYGGWGKPSTADIATAAKAKFGDDWEAYIEDKLNGGTPAQPVNPGPKTADEWNDVQTEVDDWCTLVSTEGLWWNGQGSKDAALGGTKVYQQAYGGTWVSYDLAARKKGISGYMFRAPGEWFAEIYAAYYSGVLKENNPHVAFLKTLETPPSP